jgi:hypothetical protein
MIIKEQKQTISQSIREVTVSDYHPDKIMQDLVNAGVVFDTKNEAYRCFMRTKDDKPLIPDYPSSTLLSAVENIRQYGCEYNPLGQSIGTLKQPLLTYAVPHPSFGARSNQVGFIVIYDIRKAPELFSSYSTPIISNENINKLKNSVKMVYIINYL